MILRESGGLGNAGRIPPSCGGCNGFNQLARGALRHGALPALRKDLIALATGVSSRCDACRGFHVKALIRLGVTRDQLMETLAICAYMGGGPTLMYAAEAVRAYDEFEGA